MMLGASAFNKEYRLNTKVCFIGGAGHSGSTLLGLLLGSHLEIFHAGEAIKTRFFNDSNRGIDEKTCKICGPSCPVWSRYDPNSKADLYEQLAGITGKSFIVDSTKNIGWLREKISYFGQIDIEKYLIFLKRDGRAVINSRIRKYPELNPTQLINDWVNQIQATNKIYDHFDGKKIKIHYEDLASHPSPILKRLCAFLEIKYDHNMLNYFNYEHHPLGGNSGTQFLVARAQAEIKDPLIKLNQRNEYYYSTHPMQIKLDLRWKRELSEENLLLFQELAGELNHKFEWD